MYHCVGPCAVLRLKLGVGQYFSYQYCVLTNVFRAVHSADVLGLGKARCTV